MNCRSARASYTWGWIWGKHNQQAPPLLYGLLRGAASPGWPSGIRLHLRVRGKRDGADYVLMEKRGELRTYQNAVTPVSSIYGRCRGGPGWLPGVQVGRGRLTRIKKFNTFLDRANLRWPREFRRVGAGKDGGADVRSVSSAWY